MELGIVKLSRYTSITDGGDLPHWLLDTMLIFQVDFTSLTHW